MLESKVAKKKNQCKAQKSVQVKRNCANNLQKNKKERERERWKVLYKDKGKK